MGTLFSYLNGGPCEDRAFGYDAAILLVCITDRPETCLLMYLMKALVSGDAFKCFWTVITVKLYEVEEL